MLGSGAGAPSSGVAGAGAGAGGAGVRPSAGGTGASADPGPDSQGAAGTSSAGGTDSGGAGSASTADGAAALADLEEYLAEDTASRAPIADEPFASVPLTREQADSAEAMLWEDYAARIRAERQEETDERAIPLGEHTLRYEYTVFGDEPATGHSLFLSLHGGGEADAATNDAQWQNQQTLYQPQEGIYLSPRGPTDTWNLWHQDHIDPLFYRLITNLIVLMNVNPNRVYVMGYSAGGDGVYQLGPRMADSWAAAAMMAGHPNDAQPASLRNIGFALHVGGEDSAFDRNLVGAEWGVLLDELQAADPEGYAHDVQIHAGKGHWMDLEDAVAVPWMAEFTRDPVPTKVVWLQDDVPHDRFYWLALGPEDQVAGREVIASYSGSEIVVEATGLSGELEILLSDAMLDLNGPVTVNHADGTELFAGNVTRTIATLARTIEGRGDPELVWSASLRVSAH